MNPSIHAAQVLPARAVLFLGIAGFHALLAYAFASGMIKWTIEVLKPDDDMEVIRVPQPLEPEQPPQPSSIAPTLYRVDTPPLPDLPDINTEPDRTASITLPDQTATISGPAALPDPTPPIHLVGRNVMPATADYYPAAEIRFGHEGTTEIRSCVDVNGRLAGSPIVEASSGRPSLDKAAVRLAQDGKYARAMRGDMPVPNCYRFRVTFTLH